jgi:outer membrane protein assembly factor BamB
MPEVMDETGFAAPTPATDGRFVAAVFATGELVCVDRKGERAWERHLGVPRNHYGHASSLLVHEGRLFVQYDQSEGSKLLAFDLATGEPAWEAARDAISWSSPILVDNKGRTELILTNSKAAAGYDPATGTLLWRVECLGGEAGSSPAYTDGVVFVSAEGVAGSAIDIGGHDKNPKVLWQWDEAVPDAASPLAGNGYLIVPSGFGMVTCLDAKTGGRYGRKSSTRVSGVFPSRRATASTCSTSRAPRRS